MHNVVYLCLAANNILLMCKWNHTFLLLVDRSCMKMKITLQIIKKQTQWSNDKLKQFLVSHRSILFASAFDFLQIIDLLATDKSQYFAKPHPIIVKY